MVQRHHLQLAGLRAVVASTCPMAFKASQNFGASEPFQIGVAGSYLIDHLHHNQSIQATAEPCQPPLALARREPKAPAALKGRNGPLRLRCGLSLC